MKAAWRPDTPPWAHYIWLIYLGFLFSPIVEPHPHPYWLWPTLLSLPVFVFLYRRILREYTRQVPPDGSALPELLAIGAMALALEPVNDSANTYVIYCAAVAPFVVSQARRFVLFNVLLLGCYGIELLVLGFRPWLFGVTCVVSIAASAGNYMLLESRRKNLALHASSEEIHRLARIAERERIGRDLHDLLGHTLSLIAIKSELAGKLLDRDRTAAAREVAEVTKIARDALKQVRTAVTGIRAAALDGEIASARALLNTADVTLTYECDSAVLPLEIETALAMIVREAVTNIQRHAAARRASIVVVTRDGVSSDGGRSVELRVSDDGRGGIKDAGNGLSGIGERVECLGGELAIDSPRGGGTLLRVRLPLTSAVPSKAVEA